MHERQRNGRQVEKQQKKITLLNCFFSERNEGVVVCCCLLSANVILVLRPTSVFKFQNEQRECVDRSRKKWLSFL
jgi:hypothetical protein